MGTTPFESDKTLDDCGSKGSGFRRHSYGLHVVQPEMFNERASLLPARRAAAFVRVDNMICVVWHSERL